MYAVGAYIGFTKREGSTKMAKQAATFIMRSIDNGKYVSCVKDELLTLDPADALECTSFERAKEFFAEYGAHYPKHTFQLYREEANWWTPTPALVYNK